MVDTLADTSFPLPCSSSFWEHNSRTPSNSIYTADTSALQKLQRAPLPSKPSHFTKGHETRGHCQQLFLPSFYLPPPHVPASLNRVKGLRLGASGGSSCTTPYHWWPWPSRVAGLLPTGAHGHAGATGWGSRAVGTEIRYWNQILITSMGPCASIMFTEKVQANKQQTRLINTFLMLLTPLIIALMKQQPTLCCEIWGHGHLSPCCTAKHCVPQGRIRPFGVRCNILTNSLSDGNVIIHEEY